MSTALTTQEPKPIHMDSMLSVIDRAARDPNTDVSKMERLLAMAKDMRATDAQSAFFIAMNDAQGEMRTISRDCSNPQTRSKYASYQAIDSEIRPIYSKHGFSMSFGSKASANAEHVIVTCRVSHRAGHSEQHEIDMPADGRGLKGGDMMTKTHATGSALTYGKRYLAGLIWNLSYGETDDDGNAASPRPQRQAPTEQAAKTISKGVNIREYKTKTGTGKQGPWTLHIFSFDNGLEAVTFSDTLAEKAQKLRAVPCDITWKPGQKEGRFDLLDICEADDVSMT